LNVIDAVAILCLTLIKKLTLATLAKHSAVDKGYLAAIAEGDRDRVCVPLLQVGWPSVGAAG
jgi:hypothetical protein